ncbi:MAG: hypothetical protein U5L96_08550 [Owenweeksia sp.]|nr:hypothetical protein [Owenweeksia sp.]
MNHRAKQIIAFIILAGGGFGATSCKFFNKAEEETPAGEPIARVYDHYLYQRDVKDIIPGELAGNDSLAFLQNYINVWAKDKLMIYKAEYQSYGKQKKL